jgi:BirA family biotin operon repressor/biotin-[acetyl-CoA-carboxylase] ligase
VVEWDVRRFESIDSTNTWVMAEARRGAAEGLVAVADHQTAGRGRLGRTWEAPPGANLLCTVLFRPDVISHLVVACVALAGRDAAAAVAGVSAGLKWPNDLLGPGGEKLAGVLAEVDGEAVAVGIGMNVGWAPPGATRLGDGVSRDEVLDVLLTSLAGWYDAGWATVARAYREASVTIGQPVRVELADETFDGTASDIDDEGHLLVDVGVCLRTITAGDVVHLR